MTQLKNFLIAFTATAMLAMSAPSWGMSSALSDMAKDLKESIRTTSPKAVFNEGAGFVDGGRVRVRFKAPQFTGVKLWEIDPPSFSASCSGVDIHLGSLSLITKDQLVNLIEQIPAMAPYLVILAIQKMCDGCASAIAELMDMANDFGQMTFGRCEDNLQALIDNSGDWGYSASEIKTSVMSMFSGEDDSPEDGAATPSEGNADKIESKNLVTAYLEEEGFDSRLVPGMSKEQATNLVLTLIGSVILEVKTAGDGQKVPEANVLQPGRTDNLIYSLVEGKEIVGNKCNNDQCMSPEENKVIIGEWEGLHKPIFDIVDPSNPDSIVNRLRVYYDIDTDPAKANLTDPEKEFLPRLPGVYAFARNLAEMNLPIPEDFVRARTKLYALDAAYEFLMQMTVDLRKELSSVEKTGGKEAYENIMRNLDTVQRNIIGEYDVLVKVVLDEQQNAFKEMNTMLDIHQALKGR
ncbi:conjugal transfer protein TraH [Marinobacter sp. P4B1]|uniref:conjugal transfer protein TraH n=1 Tax=Marinobacter sp. P4B1 TaxID=1119533 RepID=UPI00071D33C2|nr:conjugal transfer protein TraH [Marinobacter sp. P4B1]KRW83633.1 hypothetical protein AQ621_16425 [Marinobacter sp. P4B1]